MFFIPNEQPLKAKFATGKPSDKPNLYFKIKKD